MPSVADKDVLFTKIDANNINAYRKINAVTLPVRYSDAFYKGIADHPSELAMLMFYKEVLVGAYACKVEERDGAEHIYILTLGVLALYRRRGLGAKMVDKIMRMAAATPKATRVHLNVHVNNEDAIAFYKAQGFTVGERLEGYYKRITPPDAFNLFREVEHTAEGAESGAGTA